jgi:hypothetical protein
MKHLRPISVAKASDAAGYLFLQLWLSMFFTIISAAINDDKDK